MQDRPWNDPGPRRRRVTQDHSDRPILKAIILDFSSVNNVDITSVQHLIDVRNQLDLYAAPHRVEWHMACINNRWTKRALASAGFGFPSPMVDEPTFRRWRPVFSVAEIGGNQSPAAMAEILENEREAKRQRQRDIESASRSDSKSGPNNDTITRDFESSSSDEFNKELEQSKSYKNQMTTERTGAVAVVHGLNRPLFHIDLTNALQSAISNAERHERVSQEVQGVAPQIQ